MIKDDVEYRFTGEQIEKLSRSLAALEAAGESVDLLKAELQQSAYRRLIGDLREQQQEYDELRSGGRTRVACATLDELPKALIKARIARGLSVEQLAERLGWKASLLRRYEENGYETASFARMVDVATVLCVRVESTVTLEEMKRIPTAGQLSALEPQLT